MDRRMQIREEILKKMREKMKEAFSRDMIIVRAEGAERDIERATNMLFERLEEWYLLYFPELKVQDRMKYCRLVLTIDKEDIEKSKKAINEIAGEKGKEIIDKLISTSGADFMQKDLEAMRAVAKEIIQLEELKNNIEKYNEIIAREVCPNLSEIGGPKIAAKLVAHVGGLQKLARLPASTIQVLGAEKALFKHLRKKTKPPKHGIIFQHSVIHSAPKELRGKLARALASKLAIAAKLDAYGKTFRGKEMKEALEKKFKEILKR
jgi:nucleolar protein 56